MLLDHIFHIDGAAVANFDVFFSMLNIKTFAMDVILKIKIN